ncbi:type II toxin-antitoxin system HicB family antitoxin [Algoriphagus yeomjeoni]|uniref:Putative RNase H-like HicB family nuclease n=1 Tax=Algoriphagus yeomjeoni TaxID=291403 RepID=A0A327PJ91_9BACT|nr:type II toxin-antitoxin system HicB family antitoxin [Algoriphagus yeomjeoni]RAI91633.1 putative RNase H-like HicB family nuclease [Algoriphagus yeomjeoni]
MERMFRIILTPELDGGFTAIVPSLPGCVTWGETLEHTKEMAKEAISLYIEDMEANGDEIPNDNNSLELSLVVA